MYKVMLIDDEPVIAEGMAKGIPWSRWECEVVAIAQDAEEGRELIRAYRPNIVFSDIAMPGEDGLMMIADLKEEFEDVEFSILTGYRDFEYARRAIHLGITRFLLKPSNMEELEEAITVMVDNLKKKQIPSEETGTEAISRKSSFVVKNALRYMEDNYDKKLTLNEVAEHVYVSQWHLSKILNKYMGQSYSDIVNSIRIRKAQELPG